MFGLLIATFVIMSHLKKRTVFWLRALAGCVACLLIGTLIRLSGISLSITAACVLLPCLMLLILWFCSDISFLDAAFGAICAYALEHLASISSTTFRLIRYDSPAFRVELSLERLIIYLIIYALAEFLVFRKIFEDGKTQVKMGQTIFSAFFLFFVAAMLYSRSMHLYFQNKSQMLVCVFLFDMLCCGFFFWSQVMQKKYGALQAAMETERALWQRQAEQYALTKENVALIDRKCHDLKHQIAALRAIDNEDLRDQSIREIEHAVLLYDASVKTGNEILDTVLAEKCMYCESNGITWTCMADGSKLDFMNPVDLYVMFENALDNAIEAVLQLEQPEQRVITVTLYSRYQMVFMQIENYFDQKLVFQDGLPQSTKASDGYHGFGLRSIQQTAQKYGGSMNISTDNNIFILSVMLPLP